MIWSLDAYFHVAGRFSDFEIAGVFGDFRRDIGIEFHSG